MVETPSSIDHRSRLDELIDKSGKSYSFFSRLIGRNAAYIQQYLKRGSPDVLLEQDALKLAHVLGVELSEIFPTEQLTGEQPALVFIPIFRQIPTRSAGEDHWPCSIDWLSKLTNQPNAVFALEAQGDVMAPSMKHGDLAICERYHDAMTLRDGMYVMKIGDNLELRRLALEPRRKLVSICADNNKYPSFSGVSRNSLSIIGRVIATIRSTSS